jgi:hypothetical protein
MLIEYLEFSQILPPLRHSGQLAADHAERVGESLRLTPATSAGKTKIALPKLTIKIVSNASSLQIVMKMNSFIRIQIIQTRIQTFR